MKLLVSIGYIIVLVLAIACINTKAQSEYSLELINQNEVILTNNESGDSYKCHPDSILYYIDKDNL